MRLNLPIKVPTAGSPQVPNIKWWFHRLRWRQKMGEDFPLQKLRHQI